MNPRVLGLTKHIDVGILGDAKLAASTLTTQLKSKLPACVANSENRYCLNPGAILYTRLGVKRMFLHRKNAKKMPTSSVKISPMSLITKTLILSFLLK